MPHLMCINYSWYLIVHARNYWKWGWTSVEIQLRFNTSWNSTHLHVKFSTAPFAYIVEAQLKFNSWMRVEIHQLKLNSFACEFFNWSTCLRSWSSTEIHQLKLNSFACEFFNWSTCLHSWSSLKFTSWMWVETHQLNASWNSPVECELKLTSWNWTHLHVNFSTDPFAYIVEAQLKFNSWMRVETHQLNASWNSPVETELICMWIFQLIHLLT